MTLEEELWAIGDNDDDINMNDPAVEAVIAVVRKHNNKIADKLERLHYVGVADLIKALDIIIAELRK